MKLFQVTYLAEPADVGTKFEYRYIVARTLESALGTASLINSQARVVAVESTHDNPRGAYYGGCTSIIDRESVRQRLADYPAAPAIKLTHWAVREYPSTDRRAVLVTDAIRAVMCAGPKATELLAGTDYWIENQIAVAIANDPGVVSVLL